jgi:endonuclease/exonuclease/phosphatase family metal-dependent hydrolase
VQGFIFTRIRISGTPVTLDVYVVHPHSEGEGCKLPCHESNMSQLAREIRSHSSTSGNPVLVMGDFNIAADPEGNAAYRTIMTHLRNPRDLWREAHPGRPVHEGYTKDPCGALTWYTCVGDGTSGKRIDYIFVVEDETLTNSKYRVVIERPDDIRVVKWFELRDEYPFLRRLSDHFGVEATLEIQQRVDWEVTRR